MKNKLCSLVLALAACFNGLAQPFPAELRIGRPAVGPLRLELLGEALHDYSIEAADALSTNGWSPLYTFSLPADSQSGFYPVPPGSPQRFYRAVSHDGPAPAEAASNFRLIDHLGKSRELNYHWNDTNVAAFVLVFAANGCAVVRDFLPALNALRTQFEPQRVRFWMINSQPQDTRSNIVSEAAALGLTLPVLHDRAQLVARAYRATTAPEAMILGRGEEQWTIVYRGAIDDRNGTNAMTQPYLADALSAHLAGGALLFKRTPPDGCAMPVAALPPVSYATDIAPLLQARCVRCHSPGNIAPWSMTDYATVRSYAPDIRYQVMAGHMPPWHADPEYGVFANNFSLKRTEAAKLVQWIDDGALRGDEPDPLADTPPPPATDWPSELGPPDLVPSVPQFNIPATGTVDYQLFNLTNPIPTNVWLRAAVIRPGNKRVVHHTFVWLGPQIGGSASGDYLVTEYLPGLDPAPWPANTGMLLPGHTNIVVQVHYTPVGQAQTDQHQLGLWFHAAAPGNAYVSHEEFSENFLIPPLAQEYEPPVQEFTLARSILLHEMRPHMHYRGKRMKYEAVYADGTSEILLSVPHYHFHWQRLYRLAEPKYLPKGTKLRISGAFDNSLQNLDNPDPTRSLAFGQQSTDEMFIGYYKYVVVPTRLNITAQPPNRNVPRGGNISLATSATSDYGPVAYQWQFNGSNLLGATNASLFITNAQTANIGIYGVVVTDTISTLTSRPAFLNVGDSPSITQQPVGQTVPVGSNATFTVTVSGTPPFGFQWRKGSISLTNIVQTESTSTFTLFNVRTNDAGNNYRVVVTNAFNMTPGVASPLFTLRVTTP